MQCIPVTATFLPPCVHVNTVATRSWPVGTGPEGDTGWKTVISQREEHTCAAVGGNATTHVYTGEGGKRDWHRSRLCCTNRRGLGSAPVRCSQFCGQWDTNTSQGPSPVSRLLSLHFYSLKLIYYFSSKIKFIHAKIRNKRTIHIIIINIAFFV